MKNFLTYEDLEIRVIRQTDKPAEVIGLACGITQKQELDFRAAPAKLIRYLYKAGHDSLLEHVGITVLIKNVSRSFLAQITRHRMSSFTTASQHYQNYSNYPDVVHPDQAKNENMRKGIVAATTQYHTMVQNGVPIYEARQVLPGSKAVQILWTINARSLAHFLNIRMCRRNVDEMRNFAIEMWIVAKNWFPELFQFNVGPDCEFGGCRQGHMKPQICSLQEPSPEA